MDRDELLKLIEDDDLGLLTIKPKTSTVATADERLITSFREINAFVRQQGKEPLANKADIREMMLYSRLTALRQDKSKTEALREHDEFGLLGEPKPIESIKDIFDDDDLGLLSDAEENIFMLKNVPEVSFPDYIASRKPCDDFIRFESLLKQCHADLMAGTRKLSSFSQGSKIEVGDFFVLKGLLVYIAEQGKTERTPDGTRSNWRLRCIFDNGTESDLLLRSLAAELYQDGRRVSVHVEKLVRTVNEVTDEDLEAGYIYVLRSLSEQPQIKSLTNLYKIGFSRVAVHERIKNAAKEVTFLMAPVAVVSVFQCYNLNPQKFELLVHHFFSSACLAIDVIDSTGRRCTPREWFVAPVDIITAAVQLLISGEIINYRYNHELQAIELLPISSP